MGCLSFPFWSRDKSRNHWKITGNQYAYLLIPVVGIIVSQLSFEFNIKKLKSNNENKVANYQTASLIRWAILEGAVFISIFDDEAPQINAVIIIIYFMLIYPTFDKFYQVVREI